MANKKQGKASDKTSDDTELVSFRITSNWFAKLEEYAEVLAEEEGVVHSPSQAARKLVVEGLKRLPSKKS